MKIKLTLTMALAAGGLLRAFAADPAPSASPAAGQPNDADMMKQMMEMAKIGDNQKLLTDRAGNWNYTVKFWMAPGAPPSESKGKAVCKMIMGGRYLTEDVTGKMEMPGPDGKVRPFTFKGMGIDGYDNAKQKFVSSWIDNMGTGVLMSEGAYDPSTKTYTYNSEEEMTPGTVTKVRETLQITDKDHQVFQWYETRGGEEMKTMEINYTRAK